MPLIWDQTCSVFPIADHYARSRLEFGHESGTIRSYNNDTKPPDHFVKASACSYPDYNLTKKHFIIKQKLYHGQ